MKILLNSFYLDGKTQDHFAQHDKQHCGKKCSLTRVGLCEGVIVLLNTVQITFI